MDQWGVLRASAFFVMRDGLRVSVRGMGYGGLNMNVCSHALLTHYP